MAFNNSSTSLASQSLKLQEEVDISSFELIKVLGQGGMGKVYLVRKCKGPDAGRLYAMKVMNKVKLIKTVKRKERAKTERYVLEAIRGCPFLVQLHYAFQNERFFHLVLDYVQGGDLYSHVYNLRLFQEDEVRIYIGELIVAIEQLHKMDVVYRDVKLENILIDKEGHVVLTDFGLSKRFTESVHNGLKRTNSFCGSIQYIAPEVLDSMSPGYGMAVDWWGIGVLTCELLMGSTPFVNNKNDTKQMISERIMNTTPKIPTNLSANARDFIGRLLITNPRKRLGGGPRDAAELKEHSFFKEAPAPFSWSALINRQLSPPFVPKIKDELDTSNFGREFTNMQAVLGCPRKVDVSLEGYSYVAPELRDNIDACQPRSMGERNDAYEAE